MTLVLGIETSCDETAAAVVRDGATVLSNVLHSQIELHRRWRGVVPEVASRSHTQRILPIVQAALDQAQIGAHQLTAVAVTNRPGMIGCLLVGMAAAKTLSWSCGIPLIGVDHVQAHVDAAFLQEPALQLPALALVASGGHTAIYLLQQRGQATRLGTTRDDAAGEALDKGAVLLGLGYPGGPAIQQAARGGDDKALPLPRAMWHDEALDFSFSGLKTALLYHLRGPGAAQPQPELTADRVRDLAASYQAAVVDVLVHKLERAAALHPVRSLCIGGGVARNELLRQRLAASPRLAGLQLVMPAPEYCSDNGAMIAALGTFLLQHGRHDDLGLDAFATTRGTPRGTRERHGVRP